MLLLSCDHLTRGFDRGPLFDDVGFELHLGERVGLVGPNGAGKTTLMRLLAGIDTPDRGEVRLHAGARVELLEQQPDFPSRRTLFDEAKSAFAHLLAAHDEMIATAEALAQATDEPTRRSLAAKYDRLNELLRHQNAYVLDHKVEEVLHGLGFRDADFHRPLETFSGGQQRRVLLARLLLSSPDVMLLDEPSNHLDIDGTRWLENYLQQQPQAMLIVSHDRYFLNQVCTRIFELHDRKIRSYPGNFQQYLRLREERFERELKEWQAQQEFIEKQEEYIRRVHYGQLARQAQSRRKALERLDRLEKPTRIESPKMHFGDVVRTGDIVFEAVDLGMSYASRVLFEGLNFSLPRGKRLGIMGPNGCGKTTLLKILLGEQKPTRGEVRRGSHVQPGYLDQHLTILPDHLPVLRAVWPSPDPRIDEQKIRDLLGRFGLVGEVVHQPVRELSGGERSRACLAKLVAQGVNVLVLDEPTNHLDVWACEALENALLEYQGTVVVVSHDRFFLNRVVDLLIVMRDGNAEVVHGNYDAYELLRAARETATQNQAKIPQPTRPAPPSKPKKPKRRFPFRKVEELEADIAATEAEIKEAEAALASPELYRDATKLKETMQRFEQSKQRLQQLYEHWEEAVELN